MIRFDTSIYTPGTQHPKHEHNTLQLSLVLAGSVSETVGSITERAHALSVVAKDPGLAHADDFPVRTIVMRLTFDSSTLGEIVDDASRAGPWIWTHHASVAKPFLHIVQRTQFGGARLDEHDSDIVDLLASLTSRIVSTKGRPPRWLEDVMLELRHSWNPGTCVRDIAQRAGVHPVYLARCVRRWYGVGVAEELRRLRMESAAASLATSTANVSTIAHSKGFADEPHLCRDFRRAFGVTPRRYRSIVRDLA
ncbi:MAG TPA: helix-turn-helix transcriptional regulator [Gemmatimonadaceae bacterium]|nr:helix-turn-helix transcriptional regulator [Gemmatimonadaceae bacterium]